MAHRVVALLWAFTILVMVAAGCGDDDDTTSSTPAEPGLSWQGRSSGTANYILDISVVGQGFAAVGENGTILVSDDGTVIRRPLTSADTDLFGITPFMDKFVVVGDSLTVLVSSVPSNGFTKSDLSGLDLGADTWLYDITTDGSELIAIGKGGIIIRSIDGTSWETLDSSYTSVNLYGATWSETQAKYVIVGAAGLIMTSGNGLDWNLQASGTSAYLYDVVWAEELSKFIACGQHGTILTSPDGTAWTTVESRPDAYLYGLAWSGTELVLLGQNGWLLTSPDVASFTLRPGPNVDLRSVEWSTEQSRFVAVGNLQTITASTDGSSWADIYDGVNTDLRGVMAIIEDLDTSLMVVGTKGTILKSDDGLQYEFVWAREGLQLNSMARRNGTAVVVGDQGNVLRSQDFRTWDTVAVRPTFLDLNSVTTSPSRFVAVGDNGTIVESVDGSSWSGISLTNELSLYDVIWDGSRFMAVGDSGLIVTSSDGQSWDEDYLGATADSLRGITVVGDTGYVVVGLAGSIYFSATGSSWTEATWEDSDEVDLLAVVSSENVVVACGTDGYRLLSSDGGATWRTVVSGTVSALRDIAWDGTRFTAVGNDTYIVTSP